LIFYHDPKGRAVDVKCLGKRGGCRTKTTSNELGNISLIACAKEFLEMAGEL
jgi:hypothetical protein